MKQHELGARTVRPPEHPNPLGTAGPQSKRLGDTAPGPLPGGDSWK